jgi:hypothetical protein
MAWHRDYRRAVPDAEPLDPGLGAALDDLDQLVQRLSRFSPRSWRAYREPITALVATLVELCERQQGRSLPTPELSDHVLTDAVAVIGGEVLDTLAETPDAAVLDAARVAIMAALAATR